jgi:hypothetical protein
MPWTEWGKTESEQFGTSLLAPAYVFQDIKNVVG